MAIWCITDTIDDSTWGIIKTREQIMSTHTNTTRIALLVLFLFSIKIMAQNKWVSFKPQAVNTPTMMMLSHTAEESTSEAPSMSIINNSSDGIEIYYTFPGAITSDSEVDDLIYKMFHIEEFVSLTDPGKPALPAREFTIAVPKGKTASIEIIDDENYMYEGYTIHPALEAASDLVGASDPEFIRDESMYNSLELYPQNPVSIIEETIYRGQKLLSLQICPVQTRSGNDEIIVHSKLHFRVIFTGGSDDSESSDNGSTSNSYNTLFNNFTINTNIDAADAIVGPESIRGKLLIVTTNEFIEAADSLAVWKKMMGYEVEVLSKASWSNDTEVKNEIHSRYKGQSNPIDFVTIIGDHKDVPPYFSTLGDYDHVTDLYFTTMDGSDDYIPDIAIGRMPIVDAEQAMVVVQKIIKYERTPVTSKDFYNHGISAAYFEDKDKNGYADRRFSLTSVEIRQYLINEQDYHIDREFFTESSVNPTNWNNQSYASGQSIPSELRKPNYAWDADAADISRDLNEGRFMLLHRDHGATTLWGDPKYTTTNIKALKNGDKLPVVFSLNCQTGKFNATSASFAETFLRQENGGAVGVYAATEISYSGYNDAFAEGLIDAIWPDPGLIPVFPNNRTPSYSLHQPVYHMGYIMNHGKMRMKEMWGSSMRKYSYELFHYFGDASMMMWTEEPKSISATFPEMISTGDSTFTLSGVNAVSSIATLYYKETIIGKCTVEGDGSCVMEFTTPIIEDGVAILTISGHNYRPLIEHITVLKKSFTIEPLNSLYDVDETISVAWTTEGDYPTVIVELSTDDFETTVITDTIPNANFYSINAPDLASDNVKIRVSELTGELSGYSLPFSIFNISSISGFMGDNQESIIEYTGPDSNRISTDETGNFILETLMPGEYTIVAKSGIYNSDTSIITVPNDVSDLELNILYPGIALSEQFIETDLAIGIIDTIAVTITNDGTAPLQYSLSNNATSSIYINEVCHDPDYLEFRNNGDDTLMAGWAIQWEDTAGTSGTYTFPDSFTFKAQSQLVLFEEEGEANDSTLYLDINLLWGDGIPLSVTLLNSDGEAVDFVKTLGNTTPVPDGTTWDGPGVEFMLPNMSRKLNNDGNAASDWSSLDSGTIYGLNSGQSVIVEQPWLELLTNKNGTISVGSSEIVSIELSGIGLLSGMFMDTIFIENNSPNSPSIHVPIDMNIIKGTLMLSAPVKGTRFDVGDTIKTEWTTNGVFPNVIIELSTDNFVSIAHSDTIENNNIYQFVAPDLATDRAEIRITSLINNVTGYTQKFSIQDMSSISGSITDSAQSIIHFSGPMNGVVETDSHGYYVLDSLLPGVYSLVAQSEIYYSDTTLITVEEDNEDVDLTIRYPELNISEEDIQTDLISGHLDTLSFVVSNNGTALLEYSINFEPTNVPTEISTHSEYPSWLEVMDAMSGEIQAGTSKTIHIEVNSAFLEYDTFSDTVYVNTNAPNVPTYEIPLNMLVEKPLVLIDPDSILDPDDNISSLGLFENRNGQLITFFNKNENSSLTLQAPKSFSTYSLFTINGELIQQGNILNQEVKIRKDINNGMLIVLYRE